MGIVTLDPNAPFQAVPVQPFGTKPPFPESSHDAARPAAAQPDPPRRCLQLWLQRMAVLLFVCVCATTGVLLLIMPWRAEWTDNYLFLRFPLLRTIMASGFFRGLCSGLGILDIWIGFWEAVHYHDPR